MGEESQVNEIEVDKGHAEPESQAPDNEQSALDSHAQQAVNKAINKKHAQFKEEERARLAAEAELAKLKSELEERSKPEAPSVPPMPDQFDDNFEELMLAREQKLRELAEFEARQKFDNEAIQRKEQERKAEQDRELGKKIEAYTNRALNLGIDKEDLERAGNYVAQSGISEHVAQFLLDDEQGPALVTYLEQHPLELDKLVGMNPVNIGMQINEIRSKVSLPSQNITNAPDPVKGVSGKPVNETSPLIQGATFE